MTNPKTKQSTNTAATAAQADSPIWARVEQLSLKLGTLEALLINTNGAASDSFHEMEEHQIDAYLSHCADLAIAAKGEAICIAESARDIARAAKAPA